MKALRTHGVALYDLSDYGFDPHFATILGGAGASQALLGAGHYLQENVDPELAATEG